MDSLPQACAAQEISDIKRSNQSVPCCWFQGYDSVHSGSDSAGFASGALPAAAFNPWSAGYGGAVWGAQQGDDHYCHAVFDNDQCYPEYVITFTAGGEFLEV